MTKTVFGDFNVNDNVVVSHKPGIYGLGVNESVRVEGVFKGVRESLGRKYIQILPTGKTAILELDVLRIETLRPATNQVRATK